MFERWPSGEQAQRMAGMWAMLGSICWMLGLIFAILGIIAEAMNDTLGLTPLSWYLLAIALFVGSVAWYIGWAVGLLYKK
jgi:uncharacterized membrane protein YbhN (UPF0104 family)